MHRKLKIYSRNFEPGNADSSIYNGNAAGIFPLKYGVILPFDVIKYSSDPAIQRVPEYDDLCLYDYSSVLNWFVQRGNISGQLTVCVGSNL